MEDWHVAREELAHGRPDWGFGERIGARTGAGELRCVGRGGSGVRCEERSRSGMRRVAGEKRRVARGRVRSSMRGRERSGAWVWAGDLGEEHWIFF
ncbi:hypothetical protein E2562_038233 [Oryza meyeriana var. granulata]|uniref:Uncharacterized protein n=1 Tax=Oryza meyeriana var. granulata TaxID=110450 RepID=A0A6G1E9C0_9ORYZ|nr:hypothetical protein E2562_038233 [Oryza meyeriana var. granulata]